MSFKKNGFYHFPFHLCIPAAAISEMFDAMQSQTVGKPNSVVEYSTRFPLNAVFFRVLNKKGNR